MRRHPRRRDRLAAIDAWLGSKPTPPARCVRCGGEPTNEHGLCWYCAHPAGLDEVIAAWAELPDHRRHAILCVVRAYMAKKRKDPPVPPCGR